MDAKNTLVASKLVYRRDLKWSSVEKIVTHDQAGLRGTDISFQSPLQPQATYIYTTTTAPRACIRLNYLELDGDHHNAE